MSNLLGMLYTGVTGINAAQISLDVTGNNIANMKNEDYSRQMAVISSKRPQQTSVGQMGRGVQVDRIERAYDEILAKTVRNEKSAYTYYDSLQSSLKEAMLYFNELEAGSGLGDAFQEYFDAWQNLANSATDGSDTPTVKRTNLLEKAYTLTKKINEGYANLEDLKKQKDVIIKENLEAVNLKLENIASLNRRIAVAESLNQPANDLRDQRDALVDQISQITTVNTYERENGEISVMIAGHAVVDRSSAYTLESEIKEDGSLAILWKSGNNNANPIEITHNLTYGTLGANLKIRNELLNNYMNQLDELSSVLITETNRIHASGQGLERLTQTTSSNNVLNPRFKLNTDLGKLPYQINEGSLRISVYWPAIEEETKKLGDNSEILNEFTLDIDINPEIDNLYSVIDKINIKSGGLIEASISNNNGISIIAANGYTFSFGEDTSGFLVAAGLNGFFTGSNAKDIAVDEVIMTNPNYIATAQSSADGDNRNAEKLAKLGNLKLPSAANTTISGFYGVFIGTLTSEKSQADAFAATKKMSSENLSTRLQSIRGVSENDELINMSLFQRVFEANSRYVNVCDEMLNTLINGLGTVGR